MLTGPVVGRLITHAQLRGRQRVLRILWKIFLKVASRNPSFQQRVWGGAAVGREGVLTGTPPVDPTLTNAPRHSKRSVPILPGAEPINTSLSRISLAHGVFELAEGHKILLQTHPGWPVLQVVGQPAREALPKPIFADFDDFAFSLGPKPQLAAAERSFSPSEKTSRVLVRRKPAHGNMQLWHSDIRSSHVTSKTDLVLLNGGPEKLLEHVCVKYFSHELLGGTKLSTELEAELNKIPETETAQCFDRPLLSRRVSTPHSENKLTWCPQQ